MCSFSAHQKHWLDGKSLQWQRITAEKTSVVTVPILYPTTFCSGKKSLSILLQRAAYPNREIHSQGFCPAAGEGLGLFSALHVLPGGQYLWQSVSSGTVVLGLLGDIHHAKKGAEGWAPAGFLALGYAPLCVCVWSRGLQAGFILQTFVILSTGSWKGTAGDTQATFQLSGEIWNFPVTLFSPRDQTNFQNWKPSGKRVVFEKTIW